MFFLWGEMSNRQENLCLYLLPYLPLKYQMIQDSAPYQNSKLVSICKINVIVVLTAQNQTRCFSFAAVSGLIKH
jgi:hypothetical protein